MQTMQAALITGKREVQLREFPQPQPRPGGAVVEIALCGICGTDLEPWLSGAPYRPSICGHEWTGTVSALGSGVAHLKEGDSVGIGAAPACGKCHQCNAGRRAHCELALESVLAMGAFETPHGGFAPSIGVDARRLYKVRSGISQTAAAMLEPATVAVHGVRRTGIRPDCGCLVLGAGPIGLLTLQVAKALGAGACAVVEPHAARRQKALALGAAAAINPKAEDVAARCKQLFGAAGPDVVFECAGVPHTIQQAATLVRRGGTVSLLGLAGHDAAISPGTWLLNEVTLIASLAYTAEEFAIAMELMQSGAINAEALHSGGTNLAGLNDALARLHSAPSEIKILVAPRE